MTYKCYPVDAPGLPFIGTDFLQMAEFMGDPELIIARNNKQKITAITSYGTKVQELVDAALFGRGTFNLNVAISPEDTGSFATVSGHLWSRPQNQMASSGPEPADVMVIGACPEDSEIYGKVLFQSEAAKLLLETLRKFDAPDIGKWYVTNVMKTSNPGGEGANLKATWISNQVHLLHQEIRLVKPKYILLLGSEAVKALFGKAATVRKYEADVASFYVDLRRSVSEEANGYEAQVMVCNSPRSVLWSQEMLPAFEKGIRRFINFLGGFRPDIIEEGLENRIIENETQLRDLCAEIDATTETKIIAMDAEWHGEHPQNHNAYLRTIQLSWDSKKSAVIKLRAAGGTVCFETTTPGHPEAVVAAILQEFMQDKRACGHYFNADMEWFEYIGLNLRKQFAPPEDWRDCKTKGGLDTALMAHAYDEVADFSLTALTLLYTTIPRYDITLDNWKKSYCAKHGLKAKELEGYGDCPDEILLPYAGLDALATYRLAIFFLEKLDKDPYGNNCWQAFWVSQKAAVPVLEIKLTGMQLDSARVDELSNLYLLKSGEYAAWIKQMSNWPELNLNSVFQLRELLFGAKYNGKPKVDGKRPRLRPRMARSVAATPILDTSKRPRPWAEIVEEGREDKHSASTNRMVMGILSHGAKNLEVRRKGQITTTDASLMINAVRDYKFISHTLRAALRPPVITINEDDEEESTYEAGLATSVCDDGFVRTTIYQTKETGRWSSARPPLQNLCFDMKTELLTQRGWVCFDELEDFDFVTQYEPELERLSLVKPLEIHTYDYTGDMVSVVADDYDMLMTPNHRMLLIETDSEDYFEDEADEFYPGLGDIVCVDMPSLDLTYVSTEDAEVSKEPYDGTVCCVTVPSSFVLVRRNGKAYVSGNSKRREADYKRILKGDYRYPVRSVLRAKPGWCLVEADYIGAELFVAAALSGDAALMEHARRNQLPEDDPDFYDIHSHVCVLAFRLDCEPSKAGLRSIEKEHMRNVAKAVVFGLFYGRGARAIAVASKEEGVDVAVEDAQRIIDTIFEMYPSLGPFFDECKSRVGLPNRLYQDPPGWLRGPFGRLRRFPVPRDKKQAGDYQRQAQNFPVQGTVADAVSLAVANLYDYRENLHASGVSKDELDYKLCLQVHDAIMLMVPAHCVPRVVKEVFPLCMREMVPLYPTALDGSPLGTGPYYFGMDIEVQQSWGVQMNPDECLAVDLDPVYAGWIKVEENAFKSPKQKNKVWVLNRGFIEQK